jgi:hypothetical protein
MKKYQNIPVTLLMAAILIGVLSFFMPKDKEKYLRDRFWTQKTFAPAAYNIILLGDSRVYRGISPDVMESKLPGMKVLNFGYSNGGLNPTIFEAAEKKLLHGNHEKVIVVGVTANCLTEYTQNNDQYFMEKKRPREDVFERKYLNGILYWFSATTPEALKEKCNPKPLSSFYSNEYHSNGYVGSEKFPVDSMEAIQSYKDDFTNYKVEESFINDLTSQVMKWSRQGIIVIGFRPPTTAPMRALEDSMGHYNEALIKTKFISAGGHWIDLYPVEFTTYDGSHLNKKSAVKLSEVIVEKILSLKH